MRVKTSQPSTDRLRDPDIMDAGYVAEFNDDGVARVTQEVGEALVASDAYDIEAVDGDDDGSTDAETTSDSDADGNGGDDA